MSAYYDKDRGRWFFEFNKVINGRRIRTEKTLPKGWNRAQAEKFNQEETARLYAIATGAVKEKVLIEEAVALYIKHQCPRLKTGDNVIKELALIYWVYEGKYLDELAEVARNFVANALDVKGNPLSPASIRIRLSYIRAACRYAQKHHGLGHGETFDIAMPTVKNERQVYADRRQMLQIARCCATKEARALVRIAFYSGMRLGEIFSLGKKSEIKDGMFVLVDTKNGSNRIVPIHPRLNVTLKYLPLKSSMIWLQRLVRRAMDQAGFNHMHFHDLRHSAASMLINNDVDLFTVGAILGHKDQRSTKRYSHLATETLTKAIFKIR